MISGSDTKIPPPLRRANPLLALARVSRIIGMTGTAFGQTALEMSFSRNAKDSHEAGMRGTVRWARGTLDIIDFRLSVSGPPPPPGALLLPNHVSYVDAPVIAAAAPCFFVAKSEIAGWPVVGPLFMGSGHIVIDRSGGRALIETSRQIRERLSLGERVCIFMEGTTTAGDRILPFQPSMFKPALEVGAPIVPVGVRWKVSHPGLTIREDLAYWREEHTFVPHLWRLLGLPGFEAEVVLGEPRVFPPKTDRAEIGAIMRAEVMRLAGLPAGIKEVE